MDVALFDGMREIVESFLSLLCDMCGASAARLVIASAGEDDRLILLDQKHRHVHRSEPGRIAGAQIPFALSIPAFHREDAASLYRSRRDGWDPSHIHPESQSWPESALGDGGCSRWRLTHQFGTRDWMFEGILEDLQFGLLLAFLRLFETLLPNLELTLPGTVRAADEGRIAFDPPLVGVSAVMLKLRHRIHAVAGAAIPVLIEGESGTGKEIIARNLHRLGERRGRPLVIVNCMELPETLLQTELFGHLKGAFTGAARDRMGLVESADGGTLFLDEIGEMPMAQQAALLRVLQEREVRRIGDSQRRAVDVRFIFATNRDLADLVKEGRFRSDLYFRINGVRLFIPPLRSRAEDIVPLAMHFIERSAVPGKSITGIAVDAVSRMLAYRWPGNVRELRNEIERIIALNRGAKRISLEMLSRRIREAVPHPARLVEGETLPAAVVRLERRMIADALRRHGGNRTRAAAALGITRQGLWKKIRRYEIDP
jgi:DNA-binding NtrC family response regulator